MSKRGWGGKGRGVHWCQNEEAEQRGGGRGGGTLASKRGGGGKGWRWGCCSHPSTSRKSDFNVGPVSPVMALELNQL